MSYVIGGVPVPTGNEFADVRRAHMERKLNMSRQSDILHLNMVLLH